MHVARTADDTFGKISVGRGVAQLVDAPHYNPKGRGFHSLKVSLEFFFEHNPSGLTMTLGSTLPLKEMSTRNISWGGKGGRCVWLTALPFS